jgi:hypothetical protein
MGAQQQQRKFIRLDDLRAFRVRQAAGVSVVKDTVTGESRLVDCSGRNRSEEQMERDVAKEAVRGG